MPSEDEDKRRLLDAFKTSSSRRMFAGLFIAVLLILFICWVVYFEFENERGTRTDGLTPVVFPKMCLLKCVVYAV